MGGEDEKKAKRLREIQLEELECGPSPFFSLVPVCVQSNFLNYFEGTECRMLRFMCHGRTPLFVLFVSLERENKDRKGKNVRYPVLLFCLFIACSVRRLILNRGEMVKNLSTACVFC